MWRPIEGERLPNSLKLISSGANVGASLGIRTLWGKNIFREPR